MVEGGFVVAEGAAVAVAAGFAAVAVAAAAGFAAVAVAAAAGFAAGFGFAPGSSSPPSVG